MNPAAFFSSVVPGLPEQVTKVALLLLNMQTIKETNFYASKSSNVWAVSVVLTSGNLAVNALLGRSCAEGVSHVPPLA